MSYVRPLDLGLWLLDLVWQQLYNLTDENQHSHLKLSVTSLPEETPELFETGFSTT